MRLVSPGATARRRTVTGPSDAQKLHDIEKIATETLKILSLSARPVSPNENRARKALHDIIKTVKEK